MKAIPEFVRDNLPILVGLAIIFFVYGVIAFLIINGLFPEEEDFLDNRYGSGASCEHRGMSPEEVRELPSFAYFRGGSCPICLDEIQSGKMCRVFPTCRHVYHARCIDLWLIRCGNCPVCRAPFAYNEGGAIRIGISV